MATSVSTSRPLAQKTFYSEATKARANSLRVNCALYGVWHLVLLRLVAVEVQQDLF